MVQQMKHKNKKGMSLHKWVSTGGKPSEYNKVNSKSKKK